MRINRIYVLESMRVWEYEEQQEQERKESISVSKQERERSEEICFLSLLAF